jgi:hypothetical protein
VHLTVQRTEETDKATFGVMMDDTGATIAVTLELPWRGNQHNISRVPPGTFPWRKTMSDELDYVTPELSNIPGGRSGVRIHIGCLPCDVKGCIAVGTARGYVDYPDNRPGGKGDGITGSHDAFRRLMNLLRDIDTGTITILDIARPAPADAA